MALQSTVDEDVVHLLKHNLSFSLYVAQRSDAALVSPEKSSVASIQSVTKDHWVQSRHMFLIEKKLLPSWILRCQVIMLIGQP